MNLGEIYGGLALTGDLAYTRHALAVEEADYGDYGGRKERVARRKRRRKKRKKKRRTPGQRTVLGRALTRARTGVKVRTALRKSTRGLKGKARRVARRAGRQEIRKIRRAEAKAVVTGERARKLTPRAIVLAARRAAEKKTCPSGAVTTRRGRTLVCKKGKWVPRRAPGRTLPQTSEEAMAFAVEAQTKPTPQWDTQAAYQVEQAGYPAADTLQDYAQNYPSSGGSSSYWDGSSGGGRGAMAPYEAAAEVEDYEEEDKPKTLLIGGVIVALLGGVGFFFYKRQQGA